jgi:superfamily I DNA/RNA helicase
VTYFIKALENPGTMRRFHVVEGALELAEILTAPLEQWRVFLHPSQRKIVERNANGPVRVLGGAGTGKTVCAMHRAKHLSQNVFKAESDRILFTTFTRNLAADIRENLRKICPVEVLKRIEVVNLDAWVTQFLKKNGYEHTIVYDDDTRECWGNALNLASKEMDLPEAFYRDEWEQIIQAQGVSSVEEYLKASRLGRGRKLNRIGRKATWPVFEEYRAQLNAKGYKEATDAIRDARIILQSKGSILPYKAVIIDEAQDMGTEAFKLIRQVIPAEDSKNDIFIVGDGHQRIYRHKVVLGRCGINIKGRSHKLRVNYRTTDETRKWAVKLLEGRKIDDLDAGVDDQKGYKCLLHGNPPQVANLPTMAEETDFILKYLKQLESEDVPVNSACLVCRTHNLLSQYEAALQSTGVGTYTIKRSAAENRSTPGLRLATMHRVKGLEFDYIIIAGVNEGVVPLQQVLEGQDNELAVEENELRERALLYVSATRAKKSVLVTSSGKKSRFL